MKRYLFIGLMFMTIFLIGNINAGVTVTLNSPANNSFVYINQVTLNASANSSTTILNYTLYDNSSGIWGARNTSSLFLYTIDNTFVGNTNVYAPSGQFGFKMTAKFNVTLTEVTKNSANCFNAILKTSDGGTTLATANFVGNVSTFSYNLIEGTTYQILCNGTNHVYGETVSFPISGVNIDFPNYVGLSQGADIVSVKTGKATQNTSQEITNNYSGTTIWNVNFCESSGICSFAPSNYTFNKGVFENTRTHNSTTFETKQETFTLNVTANSSLTGVSLNYDGTLYPMTYSNGNWTKTLSITSSMVGTNSFNYKFTYVSETFYSSNSTQVVNQLVFALCNATYSTKFINFTFKDESTLSSINATIPSSTFYYWIGDSSLYKTLTFTNSTANYDYAFCSNAVNDTIKVNSTIQYASSGYPQRIYNPSTLSLTNITTNTTLYLLGSSDGLYVTYQILNPSNQVLSGVTVNASRIISGVLTLIAQGTTGDDGSVTFWLNPDYEHTLYFVKSGFTTEVITHFPTQSSYSITLGGASAVQLEDYSKGITIRILPSGSTTLSNNTNYNFNMTISTSYWDLDSFGIFIRLSNGTILDSDSSTDSSGGVLNILINSSNYSVIYLDYYYTVNGTNITGTARWIVVNSLYNNYGIKTFFTDLGSYMDSGLFGLDNFAKNLIIYLILFFTIGIFSYKYGASSPLAVSLMVFVVVYFFDVTVGLIDTPNAMIDHVFTWFVGLVTAVLVIKEVIE